MTTRTHLILVGISRYRHWDALHLIPPLHRRFAEYVREHWPDARIVGGDEMEPWTTPALRGWLADSLSACQDDDDLILLWSGHGVPNGTGHHLITCETPALEEGALSTHNSITASELADYIVNCPARRIVILLDSCWSGDGAAELAALIKRASADVLDVVQQRSAVVISSARREPAADGAFVSAIVQVLSSQALPAGLAPEHHGNESDLFLTPDRLCAAVNQLLSAYDHQAEVHSAYGNVGNFFPRPQHKPEAPVLPASVVARLASDFPGQLAGHSDQWDVPGIHAALRRHAHAEPSGELSYRLRKLALGLSALGFLERWLGSDAGLANHLAPAWASVLSPIHRIPRPAERFGFIEQVVLHSSEAELIEFVARVIKDAGDNPHDDRLYLWARSELAVDQQVVDDALSQLDSRSPQHRLIINFGATIAADGEENEIPESAIAWIYRNDERHSTSDVRPFKAPYDVADMVGSLVTWASAEVGDIAHVDVALPVSLFGSATRSEEARRRLRREFSRPVLESSGLVVRWAERISSRDLQSLGLRQANVIAAARDPFRWVRRRGKIRDFLEHKDEHAKVVAFMFPPDDIDLFYAAAYSSPYILWPDGKMRGIAKLQDEVRLSWPNVPHRVREAYRSADPSAIRSVRVVWDDPEWLEKIVPKLTDPDYRLSV